MVRTVLLLFCGVTISWAEETPLHRVDVVDSNGTTSTFEIRKSALHAPLEAVATFCRHARVRTKFVCLWHTSSLSCTHARTLTRTPHSGSCKPTGNHVWTPLCWT